MVRLEAFEIIFDTNNTVYHPGQQVSGKCVVNSRKEIKMKALRINMRGVAKVHWTESKRTRNARGTYTTTLRHYSAQNEYFNKRQVLFGSETGDGQRVLSAGNHEFSFSFELPPGGISTSFEGKFGNVRYWLQAEVERPWTFNKKTKKAFTVISPIDINMTEYLMPVERSVEKMVCCFCCTSGPITLVVKSDRKGYCPGESIAIAADFENHSNRTIVPHATLHQTQTFLAGGKSRSRDSKFTVVTGLAIRPGRTANWDAQLLKIPAVSPSIIDCPLMRVDYAVKVALEIPGACNLSVDLPIVIGTVPLRNRPLNYPQVSTTYVDLAASSAAFYPSAPPYSEIGSSTIAPFTDPPPTYAECVDGSVNITDEDDGEMMGDTHFTPMYTYVHDYHYQPPPPYSEIGTHPIGHSQGDVNPK